ncbi:PfkB family carbohydrate kinase [Oscillatoria sp. FACHB-1406]|uniref:PfkB family carbohydrate kinase n=1 Tax=Oscillatoria sp. FACHB-1406 TaxID=2692846 RepID=UPI001686DEC7|nr:PfkB family carbohydrate kinase [Oscillatoria sp. FACHB-1406]MBD2576549.1 sugar kinase [Oscillatoria sp. FACHB-1406]
MQSSGLFIGMVTLDLIYRVDRFPHSNQKIAASDCAIAAGGPATNAAVAFSTLGSRALLLGAIGNSPYSRLIQEDLEARGVTSLDVAADATLSPPISSIITTKETGDRAVVSLPGSRVPVPAARFPPGFLLDCDIILWDGHQLELSRACADLRETAARARAKEIPIVLDGGSWKPGLQDVLPAVDYAICSDDFYPPSCNNRQDVLDYLTGLNIPYIAITGGERPIQYLAGGRAGWVDVPSIEPVDTLGAGDIFHGAFCHYILKHDFLEALSRAAEVAAFSCQFFGTRAWCKEISQRFTLSQDDMLGENT